MGGTAVNSQHWVRTDSVRQELDNRLPVGNCEQYRAVTSRQSDYPTPTLQLTTLLLLTSVMRGSSSTPALSGMDPDDAVHPRPRPRPVASMSVDGEASSEVETGAESSAVPRRGPTACRELSGAQLHVASLGQRQAAAAECAPSGTCFICLRGFSQRRPSMRLPCAARCNEAPVHARCIWEWSERASAGGASCPLCRGSLTAIDYTPVDVLGSARLCASVEHRRDFVLRPVPPEAGMVQMYIRVVSPRWFGFPAYELFLERPSIPPRYPYGDLPLPLGKRAGDCFLLRAHKYMDRALRGRLVMSLDAHAPDGRASLTEENTVAVLESTFAGLEHVLVDMCTDRASSEGKPALACVRYFQNRVGLGVGPRRMQVALPPVAVDQASGVLLANARTSDGSEVGDDAEEDDDIDVDDPHPSRSWSVAPCAGASLQQALYRGTSIAVASSSSLPSAAGGLAGSSGGARQPALADCSISPHMSQLVASESNVVAENRPPVWLDDLSAYSLDFKGRVTLASNKNFQLVTEFEPEITRMQFGKVFEDDDLTLYTMDIQFPLSPLQAFAIAISSSERKLGCA